MTGASCPSLYLFQVLRSGRITFLDTEVTLTMPRLLGMLPKVPQKSQQPRKQGRPPRIRVPNNERALFTVEECKFIGIIQRLSLTGGSALLAKGLIPQGTVAKMALKTVFGKVSAEIEFLHTGADGIPLAQAFRFLYMDDVSSERFSAAARQMESLGFADVETKEDPVGDLASRTLSNLGDSIRRLAVGIASARRTGAKS
jgi:hypothetical protein